MRRLLSHPPLQPPAADVHDMRPVRADRLPSSGLEVEVLVFAHLQQLQVDGVVHAPRVVELFDSHAAILTNRDVSCLALEDRILCVA